MIWVKSFLAGVAALIIVTGLALRILLVSRHPFPQSIIGLPGSLKVIPIGDGGIGSYGIGPFPLWLVEVAAALLVFGSGFYWNFRRSRHHR
jgi:hypothetical protein